MSETKEKIANNVAALRKTLSYARRTLSRWKIDTPAPAWNEFDLAMDEIDTALAAPPRNCDMPLVVDGPADNNADRAWLVFKRNNPDAYFDVPGLLRCIDWLLASAKEKKGGAK